MKIWIKITHDRFQANKKRPQKYSENMSDLLKTFDKIPKFHSYGGWRNPRLTFIRFLLIEFKWHHNGPQGWLKYRVKFLSILDLHFPSNSNSTSLRHQVAQEVKIEHENYTRSKMFARSLKMLKLSTWALVLFENLSRKPWVEGRNEMRIVINKTKKWKYRLPFICKEMIARWHCRSRFQKKTSAIRRSRFRFLHSMFVVVVWVHPTSKYCREFRKCLRKTPVRPSTVFRRH